MAFLSKAIKIRENKAKVYDYKLQPQNKGHYFSYFDIIFPTPKK